MDGYARASPARGQDVPATDYSQKYKNRVDYQNGPKNGFQRFPSRIGSRVVGNGGGYGGFKGYTGSNGYSGGLGRNSGYPAIYKQRVSTPSKNDAYGRLRPSPRSRSPLYNPAGASRSRSPIYNNYASGGASGYPLARNQNYRGPSAAGNPRRALNFDMGSGKKRTADPTYPKPDYDLSRRNRSRSPLRGAGGLDLDRRLEELRSKSPLR